MALLLKTIAHLGYVPDLRRSKKPLRTADIYNALMADGYPFTVKEPKKILGIRLYKMSGVQALGGGLFKAK